MLLIYLGIYILVLLTLWGFFLIARHHSFKFQRFSTNIVPVTNVLMIFLIILSLLGGMMIFYLGDNSPSISLDRQEPVNTSYY